MVMVDLEKELTEDMVDDVEEDKVEDMEEGQVLGGVWWKKWWISVLSIFLFQGSSWFDHPGWAKLT